MSVQSAIEQKLTNSLTPSHLEVINESHMHNVPPGSESHFKVVIVTDVFDGISRVRRHQQGSPPPVGSAAAGRAAVLYLRYDGHYGLITPAG